MSPGGWLLVTAMSVIWGIPYLLIKVAVDGVSAPVLVFARTAIGAARIAPAALRAHFPSLDAMFAELYLNRGRRSGRRLSSSLRLW